MYGYESWAVKKAEHQRNYAFELWCWRRLLRVPWTTRRLNESILRNQSWIFNGRTDAEADFGHLMQRTDSLEKPWCWERLRSGGDGDDRAWDGWMASMTRWTWVWASSGPWWWTGKPGVLQSMESQRVRHDWETELNWWIIICVLFLSHWVLREFVMQQSLILEKLLEPQLSLL